MSVKHDEIRDHGKTSLNNNSYVPVASFMSIVAVGTVIVTPSDGCTSSAVKLSVNSARSSLSVCKDTNAIVLPLG